MYGEMPDFVVQGAAWGEAQYDLGKWTDNDWISTSVDGEDPVKSRPQGYELGRLRDRSTMDPNLANRFASFVREISRQLVETGMLTMGYMKSFDQREFDFPRRAFEPC